MKRFGLLCLLVLGILRIALPATAEEPEPLPPRPLLRLPFLPGEGYVVTCGYGCYQHQGSMFYAVDFATPEGTPIVAAANGVVAAITWEVGLPLSKNLGDALILYLDHGGGWFTRYVHLSGVTVAVGDDVEQGEVIGYAGHTGAEGAHLHFELKQGQTLHAPSQPIDELFGGHPPQVGQTYVAAATRLAPTPTPHIVLATPTPTAPRPLSAGLTTPLVMPVAPTVRHTSLVAGEPFTVTLTLQNSGTTPLSLPIVGVIPQQQEVLLNRLVFTREIVLAPGERRTLDLPLSLPAGTYVLSPFAFSETYTLLPIGVTDETPPTISLQVENQRVYVPLVAR